MVKQYLKLIFRIIKGERVSSIINITGLSTGLACAFIILLFVISELTYDRCHQHRENTFMPWTNVVSHGSRMSGAAYEFKDVIDEKIPQIASSSREIEVYDFYVLTGNDYVKEYGLRGVDPDLFDIFTLPILFGDHKTALSSNDKIILSESMAEKYFGEKNAVGKGLRIYINDTTFNFVVDCVIKDIPVNSTFQADFMVSPQMGLHMKLTSIYDIKTPNLERYKTNYMRSIVNLWLKIENIQNQENVIAGMNEAIKTYVPEDTEIEFTLKHLPDMHFTSFGSDTSISGNIKYLRIFASIGILILIIVSINYIILSIAKSTKRAKEIGLRKVAGASRKNIIGLIMGESIGISIITLPIAVTIAELILPTINRHLGLKLEFNYLENWLFTFSAFGLTILIGLISGSYLSFYLSRFNPIKILKNQPLKNNSVFLARKVLLIVQISIFIFLLVASATIQRQFHYMNKMPVGYNRDNLYILPITDRSVKKNFTNFMGELRTIPGIKYVGAASGCPPSSTMAIGTLGDEWLATMYVADELVDAYEFELVKGRYFSKDLSSDKNSVLINEEAVKELGLKNPVGKQYGNLTVIGIIKNFQFISARDNAMPFMIQIDPEQVNTIAIKLENELNGDIRSEIEATWNQFAKIEALTLLSIQERLRSRIKDDYRFKAIINGFTILAIFLASMGLFGSCLYIAEQRSKEIGIRKVFGSKNSQVLILINQHFIKYALFSMIFAFPAGYYITKGWLQNFASRVSVSPIEFIVAGTLGIVIIITTISYIAIKYSRANPVDSIRYE